MKYFLLFLTTVIILCSCAGDNSGKFVVGISQCSEDLWRSTVNQEMMREASLYDMELIIRSVRDDTPQQIKDIEELIDSGIDILVVSPNEASAVTPVVQKAYQKGIPVILFDRKIESDNYTAYIGADNYHIGYELGLYVVNLLGERGNVVEMRGWNGSTADAERHEGFRNAVDRYPGIDVIAELRGDFLEDTSEREMTDFLRNSDKTIDLVFAMNDPMAYGINKAVMKFSGSRPFIVGIDAVAGEGGGIESILRGAMDASFIYPTGGDRVIQLAYDILTGKKYQRENILNTAVVDRQNARVIKLQTDQISQHQEKIDRVNQSLSNSLGQYSTQRNMLVSSGIAILLAIVLLIALYVAYKNKIKTNHTLSNQNREIRNQAEELSRQKEHLIQLQSQLEEATHEKLVFFTNISHEFRTPLTLITGPVETLLAVEERSAQDKEMLTLIYRNSKRLLSLITEVIEFRRAENGKMTGFFVKADIINFLRELNSSFLDYAARKRISFLFESDVDDLQMHFDSEKIEKIYFNLLSNAFKHTKADGTIKVKIACENLNGVNYARLSVFNKGNAIPQDKLLHIFDRFYKVNHHDTGTGIGLALTRTLVEEVHNGRISAESEEGVGTTFTVWLPIEQTDNDIAAEDVEYANIDAAELLDIPMDVEEEILPEEDSQKPLALIIEDNADLRRYMRLIMEPDYTVIEQEDGKPGVEMAKKCIPDIIISDVMMPEMDGFEVCRQLKGHIATSHIPVILLTACSLDEQKAIGFESGADAYIPKPFNAELLKIRAEKLIENRRRMKEVFGSTLMDGSKGETIAESEQKFINEFKKYVGERISNPELALDDIARDIGISRIQLYRKIKSLTNHSPNELIRAIRLKQAARILSAGNCTIAEVAYQTGFSSPSYFTKCFKEFFKKSPTEYIGQAK